MTQQKHTIFFLFVLAAGLAWIFASADRSGTTTAGQIPAPQQGFLAPDFSLPDLAGQSVTLSDLRGQVVVLNIWATWCPPCRAEMPALQAVYADYAGRDLLVLAVNSTVQDDPAAIAPFLAENGLTFPVLLDGDGTVTGAYQVRSLPTTFFIGRDGVIREVVVGGPMAEALLRARIDSLLAEAR
jgi:peroxiredoxin